MISSSTTLYSYLRSIGPLTQQQMLQLIYPVVEAVANMHKSYQSPQEISLDTIEVENIDGQETARLISTDTADVFDSQRDVDSLSHVMLQCVAGIDQTDEISAYRSLSLKLQQTLYNINHAQQLGLTWDAVQLLSALDNIDKKISNTPAPKPLVAPPVVVPTTDDTYIAPKEKKSHGTLYIILLLLFLAACIAYGIYYYINSSSYGGRDDEDEEYYDADSARRADSLAAIVNVVEPEPDPEPEPPKDDEVTESPSGEQETYYYDLAFNQLKPGSPVKELHNEYNQIFDFERSGKWKNENYSDNTYTDRSWYKDYLGRRVEEYYTDRKTGERGTMKYTWSDYHVDTIEDTRAGFTRYNYYDSNGNLSSASIIYDDPEKSNKYYTYTDYRFDSYGNWISRKSNGTTQTRTIIYY